MYKQPPSPHKQPPPYTQHHQHQHLSQPHQQQQQQPAQTQPQSPQQQVGQMLPKKVVRICKHCNRDKSRVKICPTTGKEHIVQGAARSTKCGACGQDITLAPFCPISGRPHQQDLAAIKRPQLRPPVQV
eukprot:TRINITY_DN18672_c0_g1_i2.p4 TRINITY_DN18672_c0_g1~~TRINITY_DN18672_c0_g1_i2.p4  ORF type:complete len:129 (+),score=32.34 TRINITY_DN18672_c0_g1_i2:487-873(+)